MKEILRRMDVLMPKFGSDSSDSSNFGLQISGKIVEQPSFFFDVVYSLSLYIVLMQGDCTMATDRLIPWRDASWFEPQWMLKNAFKTSLDFFFSGSFQWGMQFY